MATRKHYERCRRLIPTMVGLGFSDEDIAHSCRLHVLTVAKHRRAADPKTKKGAAQPRG